MLKPDVVTSVVQINPVISELDALSPALSTVKGQLKEIVADKNLFGSRGQTP